MLLNFNTKTFYSNITLFFIFMYNWLYVYVYIYISLWMGAARVVMMGCNILLNRKNSCSHRFRVNRPPTDNRSVLTFAREIASGQPAKHSNKCCPRRHSICARRNLQGSFKPKLLRDGTHNERWHWSRIWQWAPDMLRSNSIK